MGREAYAAQYDDVWSDFGSLWEGLAIAYEEKSPRLSETSKRSLAFGLSKLQRNLIAGVQHHQKSLL